MSASRILLLGEGMQDVGRIEPAVKRRPPCDFEGDLPRLVRRLSGTTPGGRGSGTTPRPSSASTPRGSRSRAAPPGPAASRRSCGTPCWRRSRPTQRSSRSSTPARRRCRPFSATSRTSSTSAASDPRRPGWRSGWPASHEIEIYRMLADPDARRAAFGPDAGAAPVPEDLEGVRDPKSIWRERAGQVPAPEGIDLPLHADAQRRAAWETLRPEIVARGCPRGFAPFARDVLDTLPWTRA